MNEYSLLWGLLFSSIGLGYFMYGRRRANAVFRYTGIALMVYPYFFYEVVPMIIIGVVLLALPRFIRL